MSGIDEAGDLVMGAMLATAAEPEHGKAGAAKKGECLNCGAPLTGAYCASCGQSAHLHHDFSAVWHELMHGVLHMDGKIWRTLPELALRPGMLTRRYIAGERAKFVSPFALFLFSALLMYATYSIFGQHKSTAGSAQESALAMQKQIAKIDNRIADAEAELRTPDLSATRRTRLQQRIADAQDDRHQLAAAAAIASDVGKPSAAAAGGRSIVEKMETDREFIAYRLKANAYKFSWALILISTPMVWLLFAWRRDYGLYDHATFVTYSISFMSLLFSIYTIGSGLGVMSGLLMLGLMLFALWHMYAQMRDAYRLTRTAALLRLPLLYGIAAVSAGMFYGLLTATN